MLVSPDACRVEAHRRRGAVGWTLTTYEPGDTITVVTVELELPIADVYFESGIASEPDPSRAAGGRHGQTMQPCPSLFKRLARCPL